MLSILHPEVTPHIQDLPCGLLPFLNTKSGKHFLVIKASKEGILAAKVNNQFKVYLIKDSLNGGHCLGLMTAFFDDHDEPLTIMTPLFADDEMLEDICAVFSQSDFEIYFFDENNFELLGIMAKNPDHERFRKELTAGNFYSYEASMTLKRWEQMGKEFGIRTEIDDQDAYTIDCNKRLYADDIMVTDLRERFHGYNDSSSNIAINTLDRPGDPGPMQEKDIARLLLRLFSREEVYLNPYRDDTDRELSDVMIVTDEIMFFIQAKDSPNTPEMLQRKIDRKRTAIRKHIQKASNQVKGALNYARDNGGVTIKTPNGVETITLGNRQLVGLIVVKELFDDDYIECSKPILEVVRELELPIGLFDYSQLNVLTQKFETSAQLINGLFMALDIALEHEQFPKSVHSGSPRNN